MVKSETARHYLTIMGTYATLRPTQEIVNMKRKMALDGELQDIERQRIIQALYRTWWNQTAAAKLLRISFRSIRYRIEKLNITKPRFDKRSA